MPHTAIARSSGFFFLFFLGSSTERNELPLDPPVGCNCIASFPDSLPEKKGCPGLLVKCVSDLDKTRDALKMKSDIVSLI